MDANSSFERGFERGFKAGVASSKEPVSYNHPLMSDAEVANHLAHDMSLCDVMCRRTGKSTARALDGLAWVISHPGQALKVYDHHGTTQATDYLLNMMVDMVRKLGLKHIVFNRGDRTVTFDKNI